MTFGEYDNGSAKSAGRTAYIWLPTDDGMPIPLGLYRGGQFYALHTDHLGTPRLMTNEANNPVWQWPYSAFGSNKPTGVLKATANSRAAITNKPVLLTATGVPEMNLGFPGQMRDVETGAFYNALRDAYDANLGAYRQMDPVGLSAGLNRRGYVGANALTFTDPLGLQATVPGPGGIPVPIPLPLPVLGCLLRIWLVRLSGSFVNLSLIAWTSSRRWRKSLVSFASVTLV